MIDTERYPIGTFIYGNTYSDEDILHHIATLAELPHHVRSAVLSLQPEKRATPYRANGWTIAQVVHHLADSHINAYTRFKLAITEDMPTIKPYDEARWAELPDGSDTSDSAIENSCLLLQALHTRWVQLLRSMDEDQWAHSFIHPESNRICPLREVVAHYAWHSRHHLAHIHNGVRRIPALA